ncbi:carboxypeptidase-like regulatory domain-containing protein [Gracilimonas sp. BCB1]|uniref:carboxypeptidase-like regulatory domain-containing protein n=1 Tax=Gracilimonas sp. BCB1 TaxID=3152362 RepID=UPI0032D9ABE0
MNYLLILISAFIFQFNFLSDDYIEVHEISGIVTDNDDNPIGYAHIGVIGVSNGTVANKSGLFSLDISQTSNNDTLFISAIGFKTKKYSLGELLFQDTMHVTLERKVYLSNDISITAKKSDVITFGRDKSGGNSGWAYSGIATGNEIGMIYRNDKNIVLSEFKFHIRATNFDSLLYRVHVYETLNDKMIHLNKTNIQKSSATSDGWVELELSDFQLVTNQDFCITVEVLEGWKNGHISRRGSIQFTGRNTISKQMLQRSHQYIKAQKERIQLNMFVTGFSY